MNKADIIILIVFLLFVIISIAIIIFKNCNERLKIFNSNLKLTKDELEEKLNEKYNLITNFIKNVKDKYKVDIKLFDDVNKINKDELDTLKTEKLLNNCYEELIQIKEDNQKKKELKVFKDIISKYEENELYIVSLRTYYNDYILKYNNLIKKFPYSLICKIKKCSCMNIIEGKELEKESIHKEV